MRQGSVSRPNDDGAAAKLHQRQSAFPKRRFAALRSATERLEGGLLASLPGVPATLLGASMKMIAFDIYKNYGNFIISDDNESVV